MPTNLASEPVYNRVPRITVDFWLIKLMAVTMGETAADYLNVQLGLGLTATSLLMTVVLIAALVWQFRQKCYVPAPYWLAVVLISIVGTLITDNLVVASSVVDRSHLRERVRSVDCRAAFRDISDCVWTSAPPPSSRASDPHERPSRS